MDNYKILITGSRKGIGKYLAEYYLSKGYYVFGCSRGETTIEHKNYVHFEVDISNEKSIKSMISSIKTKYQSIDVLINNAGIASMNHSLLTPTKTVERVLKTNVLGLYLCCREVAKILKKSKHGRIVNFCTVATPLKLEGEAIYAASKAAVISLTQILAKEFSDFGITVNCIGPTPIKTDLIRSVPDKKLKKLINQQAIKRYGKFEDVSNVIDFFISPDSDFITGQILYLGGVS